MMGAFGGRHQRKRPALGRPPSPRSVDVLKARFRRGSRKEGAASLGIADGTARWHITALCERLGVSSSEEAAYVLWLRDLWGEGDRPTVEVTTS